MAGIGQELMLRMAIIGEVSLTPENIGDHMNKTATKL